MKIKRRNEKDHSTTYNRKWCLVYIQYTRMSEVRPGCMQLTIKKRGLSRYKNAIAASDCMFAQAHTYLYDWHGSMARSHTNTYPHFIHIGWANRKHKYKNTHSLQMLRFCRVFLAFHVTLLKNFFLFWKKKREFSFYCFVFVGVAVGNGRRNGKAILILYIFLL